MLPFNLLSHTGMPGRDWWLLYTDNETEFHIFLIYLIGFLLRLGI